MPRAPSLRLALVVAALLAGGAVPAAAAKLFVAANGSDVAGCGAKAAPCRSVGAALARAAAGDTVEVGPGRYGELDNDGAFDAPGEEPAQVDTGCDCMVHLALPVRLVSRDGAGATILDAGGAPIDVVRIDAPGAVLGRKRRGFTLTGSGDANGVDSAGNGVRLEANVASANDNSGLVIGGDGGVTLGNRAILNLGQGIDAESSDGLIRGNQLVRNDGEGLEASSRNRLLDNLAVLNGGVGIRGEGSAIVLRGNASLGNASGFELLDENLLERSVAAGNGEGLVLFGPDNRVQRNAIVGNLFAGARLDPDAGGTIQGNSLFGNEAGNCGVATENPLLAPLLGGNFWGAPSGPGADPADAFCELVMAPIPVFEPLAAKEARVRSKAAQLLSKLAGKLPGSPPIAPPRLFVAANGVDGPGCGAAASPCRSIGSALQKALAGDTLEVGPGQYGDLNLDGAFDDPGEEAAEIDSGCDCMIHVNVPVNLVSRDGAGATLLHASGTPIAAVSIDAAGTTIGAAKRGFTVTGSLDDSGIRASADGVRIESNLLTGNAVAGALIDGAEPVILGNQLIGNVIFGVAHAGVGGLIRGNVSVGNGGLGFDSGQEVTLEDNLALGNGSTGFDLEGSGCVARRNAAIGNGTHGFLLATDSVLEGNLSAGNVRGVTLEGAGSALRGNAIVGNRGPGVFVAAGAGGEIVGNSIFGNFAGPDLSLSPGLNCGVALDVATPPLLSGNFWGAASGPGADPADAVCALVALTEPVVVEPVAPKEIRARVKAAQ